MTTLPIWAVYAVSLGSPSLAFLGVFLSSVITRRGARELRLGAVELEARSQREEAMRTLRWACEQAASPNPKLAAVGVGGRSGNRARRARDGLTDEVARQRGRLGRGVLIVT